MTASCRACGAQVLAEATYCHQCGQPLTDPVLAGPEGTSADPIQSGGQAATNQQSTAQAVGAQGHVAPSGDDAERTLWEGSYSVKAVLGGWIVAALVTLAATGVGMTAGVDKGLFLGLLTAAICFGGTSLYVMYWKLSTHYQLTSLRFIHQAGLLHRVTDRIEVIDVDDVAFSQGPIERMAGVGTIKIMSSDSSHSELFLEGIDRVAHVANLIDEARRAERRRRGLFIEAI